MRGSRKIFRAINLESFVIDINGQSLARQRNAIEMTVCWRDDDAGDPDQYCKETLHFCAFSGGGVQITCPPLWICPCAPILILIDRPHARNLSSGLELRGFQPCQTRIKLLRQTYRKV